MLKSSFLALFRSKKALLLVLLGVLSITTSVVLYRVYVHRDQVAVKPVDKKVDEQIKALLKKDREDLKFIENKGQWPKDVLFALESTTGATWIRKNDVLFRAVRKVGDEDGEEKNSEGQPQHEKFEAHTWSMQLEGMNPDYKVRTGEPQPTTFSYLGDPDRQASGARSFKEVTLEGVYPGIDLRFYSGNNKQMEYDFIVAPGADYRQIKAEYQGLDSIKVGDDGSIELGLRFGTVKTHLPEAYQVKNGEKQLVGMGFRVDGNTAAFEPKSEIDPALPLVIDPTLLWATYFDNNTDTFDAYAYASKANVCGEVYVGGFIDENLSGTAPYTLPALNFGTYTATYTAVVYRFNAAGTALLGIAFVSGAGTTEHDTTFIDIDIFPDGRVIAVGRTQTTIATVTPYQATKTAATDGITGMVVVLNSTLTAVNYASYLGGNTLSTTSQDTNAVRSVSVLNDTTYFVGGVMTGAAVTAGFETGGADATTVGTEGYVARFSNYNTRDWGTFIGGDGTDNVFAINLSTDNTKIVFAGDTVNTAVANQLNGAITNVAVTAVVDSTAGFPASGLLLIENELISYAGITATSFTGLIRGVNGTTAAGHADNIAVSRANTPGFPNLVNAADSSAVGGAEVFAGYFNVGSGAAFGLLSYAGGSLLDQRPVVVADNTQLYLAASTTSTNLPSPIGALAGGSDIYVARIPFTGGANNIITRYLGGSGADTAGGILLTLTSQVLVFGTSTDAGTDYPVNNTVPGSNFFDGTHGGGLDIVFTYLTTDLATSIFSTFIGGSNNDYLGDTGVLAGGGHLGYQAVTGVVTLATTTHSLQSTFSTPVLTAGAFDPTTQNTSATKDNHIILKFSAEISDYGDAPLLYDGAVATAASHGSSTGSTPRFGALVDVDTGAQSSPLANLDDTTNTVDPCAALGDDEDGVASFPVIACGSGVLPSYVVTINATTAVANTFIYAWLDVDGDGIFEDSAAAAGGEFQTATIGISANAPVLLTWTNVPAAPTNTLAGQNGLRGYYARFRITTVALTDAAGGGLDDRSRGAAANGEVEDYFIPFESLDYGDAPNTYGTNNAATGARARIRNGLFIGGSAPVTDIECDGTAVGTGTQDDAAGTSPDDETGITSLSIGTGATSVNISISVTNNTGSDAKLCAWIDFNRNGIFEPGGSPDEGVCSAPIPSSGSPQLVNLVWPLGAAPTAGASYMRLRLSTDPTLADTTPTGALTGINDGEVEDFPVSISALTAVDLASFKAYQLGDSVFLDWKTGYESDNLGFNVYRDLGGERTQVTPSLLAGSALMVGSGIRLEAGLSYGWRDDAGKRAGKAQYWLEEVDLSGATRMHGPFSVQSAEMMPITQRFQIAAQPRALRLNEMSDRLGELGGSRELEPSADLVFSDERSAPARISNVASGTRIPAQARITDLSGQAAIKIEVEKAGWYRVSQPDLVAAGLGKVDPRNLQLYAEGKQVPIRVTGEDDASFDTGDAIEFFGVGLDTPSTDARVYWLMASRLRGQRMPSSGAGGGGSPPPSFTHTVVRKDRLVYVSAVLNGEADNFFGVPIAGSNPVVNQVLSTPNAYTEGGGGATLEVAIQGVSVHDHVIRVSLNGQNLGSVSFSAQQKGVKSFNVAQTLLVAGDNQVKLERQSLDSDVTLVDSLKLTYQHAWKADNNAVTASAANGQQVNIGGFTSPDLRIVDITDADSPVELNSEVTGQQGAYSVSAAVTGAGTRRLYAFASDQVRTAASLRANTPSTWKSQLNGANFVIISHSSLIPGVVPLASLRKSQGWNVAIVDVDDIYDEFAFGAKTPEAIADFLRLAGTTWKVKPQAVLLVGKATYDPRSYLGQGDADLVPTHMVETQTMESAVDDSLADFNGDGIPEMAVGRLPVRNLSEAVAMVRKIIGYEGSEPSNRVALIADISDTYSFDAVNEALKATVPSGVDVQVISRGALGDATTRTRILEELDRSHRIVNYTGHGSIQLWRGDVLTVNDAASLQKSTELSLFVMMTCLNGYFISPLSESLSESLLRSGGGAVAAWASSGTTTPEGQQEMNVAAFQQLYGGQNLTIGEAARRAKAAVAEPDVRRTWNLLGDPTMRLK